MKTYDKICNFENLLVAYMKARRDKTLKWYVRKFEKDLEKNIIKLESELRSMTYKPHELNQFIIRDPKTRTISSSHFRDRVVHHAICNVLEPIFEKRFIYDSYASRKGKGLHAAIRRFDEFKRKTSRNGRLVNSAKNNDMVIGYVLKADVKHYFDTVDHSILIRIIRKKIADEKTIWLIGTILNNHKTRAEGKGMPIGNLTSQFFANVYLNELDYFVKHRLRAKYYIRYLDDFVILHEDKIILSEWKHKINEFLNSELDLELHPDKSKIYPLCNGITFLGFRVFYHYKLLKMGATKRICERIDEYIKDGFSTEHMLECLEGWNAYAKHANTYKVRKAIMKSLKSQ